MDLIYVWFIQLPPNYFCAEHLEMGLQHNEKAVYIISHVFLFPRIFFSISITSSEFCFPSKNIYPYSFKRNAHNSTTYIMTCACPIHFLSYRTVVYSPDFIADKTVESLISFQALPPLSELHEVSNTSGRNSTSCVITKFKNCFDMLKNC